MSELKPLSITLPESTVTFLFTDIEGVPSPALALENDGSNRFVILISH